MLKQPVVAFIGAGNMAQAILKGLLAQDYPADHIWATARSHDRLQQLATTTGVHTTHDNQAACRAADVIVMGVKPQMMANVTRSLAPAIESQLVISVAAGILLDSLENWLSKDTALVRCMPNTPSLVGAGAAGLFANQSVNSDQKACAEYILTTVGLALWVTQENQLDMVTAVSGSGPAYYFLLMEAMIDAAQELGLDLDIARQLVLQTALGAATMAHQSQSEPAQLRQAVTSPKGVTEQALRVFERGHFKALCQQAMLTAQERSRELAELYR